MHFLKYIKNISLVFIILGHYYFCGYLLSEVHNMKNYEPKVNVVLRNENNEKKTTSAVKLDSSINEEKKNVQYSNVIATIEIPKISLRRSLYKIGSNENNVNKNIEILKDSNMPDIKNGNFILAAHNGNTSVGHFKNLHKINIGDLVTINYNGQDYTYEISKKYDVLKTGTVMVKRNKEKNTITLITCLGNDRQLVVIGYLKQ